ncbi:MAG: type II secretion system protein J [Oscillospiraceae bacterium]
MRKIRGFTLVECIIALAILGIGALVMAQIYASVSNVNRANHQNNSSIAYQMKYVEQKTNTEAMKVKSGESIPAVPPATGVAPPVSSSTVKNITLTRKKTATLNKDAVYSYAVDYYVLMSRDQNDQAMYKYNASTDSWSYNTAYQDIYKGTDSSVTVDKQKYVLNYKYFAGYSK